MVKMEESTCRLLKMFGTTIEGTMKVTRCFQTTLRECEDERGRTQRNVHTMIFQSHVHSLQRVVTIIPTNLHTAHAHKQWLCEGSHWWFVVAQIPVYLKHYFRLHFRILCEIFLWDKIKNAFEFGWGIKIRYGTAHTVRLFAFSSHACSIAFWVVWKNRFSCLLMLISGPIATYIYPVATVYSVEGGAYVSSINPFWYDFFSSFLANRVDKFWCVFDSHTESFVNPRLAFIRTVFMSRNH